MPRSARACVVEGQRGAEHRLDLDLHLWNTAVTNASLMSNLNSFINAFLCQ